MAKFYGQVNGGRGTVTRLGYRNIRTSAQSYDGSIQTELTYNDEGNIDDSCDEDTQYATDEVINQLEKIVSDFEEFVMREKELKEKIADAFNL